MENINRKICKFISETWIHGSRRSFAIDHNIDEKTVRRIIDDENYSMTIETLEKICQARDISLSDFFKLINR